LSPSCGSAGADGGEQQAPEGRAVDRAAAAEDGHATDDRGRDDEQLLAGAGGGVQRLEAAAYRTPASPASAPLTTKAVEHPRPTGMPESRAASGREPMP
jgi:hypothetical protein